jgi:hypothetical protein
LTGIVTETGLSHSKVMSALDLLQKQRYVVHQESNRLNEHLTARWIGHVQSICGAPAEVGRLMAEPPD